MAERPCLMTVHAHPDDEASKGAGTVARYAAAGVHCVLVCCTGGEAGDILNPAMDRPEVRARLDAVRREELAAATAAIGYHDVVMLGYRDSGMPDSEANADPTNFWNADLHESTGRLVEIIRRVKPQVLVTYNDDQSHYPHPDHLRVHDISVAAFDLAGDANAYPDAGPPWTVDKLYYTVWSRERVEAVHAKMLELGITSPFSDEWFERPSQDHRITTRIDVSDQWEVRKAALLAHATQVAPDSPFWFGLPDDVAQTIHPEDVYVLAQSRVHTALPEDDLFAGIDGVGS
ncbi:MAG: mycothiol conjugate amidase Mca [Acidimicrobiia bacterium]|nr:mycothiol conjugate amidase Mca [Acidimicrobiia bacterium]